MKKIKSKFLKIKNLVLDIFFPSFCVSCKKEGSFLCSLCEEKIEIFAIPSHILKMSKIERLYCATEYKQKPIEKLIYNLKYQFIRDAKKELGRILIKHLEISGFERNDNQILVPIPLHKRRLRWRGFNQSELLAQEVGIYFNIPVVINTLLRNKYTEPQTLRDNKKEREENMKNAFLCENGEAIKGKEVILIDDVITTGATLRECSKAIFKKKANKIIAMVIAK
ncbi:MAG: ComF family protein [Patescibacteria group bacterium]